jgi:hypothetical protein
VIGCLSVLQFKRGAKRECAWFTGFAAATLIGLLAGTGAGAQHTSDGFRVMAREKSLAESFLVLLNDLGKKDVSQYATGITRYAAAKADFDGLISELEHELVDTTPPDQSAAFDAALKEAVDKRVAFTSFVTDTILPHTDNPPKGIGDFIKGGGDLIKALTEAGIAIWREFRSAGEARRTEIKLELETLRWPQFSAGSNKPGR